MIPDFVFVTSPHPHSSYSPQSTACLDCITCPTPQCENIRTSKIPGHSFYHAFYERIRLPATPAAGTVVSKTLFRTPRYMTKYLMQWIRNQNFLLHKQMKQFLRPLLHKHIYNANKKVVFACVFGQATIKDETVCRDDEVCPIIYSTYVAGSLLL